MNAAAGFPWRELWLWLIARRFSWLTLIGAVAVFETLLRVVWNV